MKQVEAFNNNDAAALAALFTEDGVFVAPEGMISGRKDIKKRYADTFQKMLFSNCLHTVDQNSPHSIGTTINVCAMKNSVDNTRMKRQQYFRLASRRYSRSWSVWPCRQNINPSKDSQDPLDAVAAAPKNHKVLYEDDHVRVLEVTVQPGENGASAPSSVCFSIRL